MNDISILYHLNIIHTRYGRVRIGYINTITYVCICLYWHVLPIVSIDSSFIKYEDVYIIVCVYYTIIHYKHILYHLLVI